MLGDFTTEDTEDTEKKYEKKEFLLL